MEGASCPERPCDYAYANAVEITPLSLISRSTRTGCAPAYGSANQQSPAAVEVRSPAIYIVKSYEDTNNINAKNSLFTKGKNDCVKDKCYRMDEYSDFNCLQQFSFSFWYLKICYRISSDNY